MLEDLGLVVHLVPAHSQALDQVELEQAVVADHLEGDAPARCGEPDAAVRLVLGEPERDQLADHPGNGAGLDAEPLRERGRRCAGSVRFERVDGLDVVLDGRGQRSAVVSHASTITEAWVLFR